MAAGICFRTPVAVQPMKAIGASAIAHPGCLVEKDPALLNDIAVIRVNPARFSRVNADGAKRFVDWLVAEEAQLVTKSFEVGR